MKLIGKSKFFIITLVMILLVNIQPSFSINMLIRAIKKEKDSNLTGIQTNPTSLLSNENLEKYSKGIVTVISKVDVPFVGEDDSTAKAIGFIISLEKGIIVVPKKVSRMGPSVVTIVTSTKKECNGTVIYYDMIYQYGIIQIEGKCLSENKDFLTVIPLGSTTSHFSAGDRVALLGRQNDQLVSKTGHLINTVRNQRSRYGNMFQSSFDQSSNLIGSPIFNDRSECVGIHFNANEISSFGLNIEYVKHFLGYFLDDKYDGKPFKRGDIGWNLSLIVVGFAKTNNKLPADISEEIISGLKKSGGTPEMLKITEITPGSEAELKMLPGDLIYKVDNRLVANDLLLLEEIITSKIGKSLEIIVYRGGERKNITLQNVDNTENFKISKFALLAGCYFHDITLYGRSILRTNKEGIYMTYCSPSSPFASISSQSENVKNNYILEAIDSVAIKSVDNLLEFFKKNCSEQTIRVKGLDLNLLGVNETETPIDIPFTNQLIQEFIFSYYGGWTTKTIDLNEYCKGRTTEFISKPDDPLYEQTVDNNPSTPQGSKPATIAEPSPPTKDTKISPARNKPSIPLPPSGEKLISPGPGSDAGAAKPSTDVKDGRTNAESIIKPENIITIASDNSSEDERHSAKKVLKNTFEKLAGAQYLSSNIKERYFK